MTAKRKAKRDLSRPFGFSLYKPKKGEEYMNEKQEIHFKAILEAWKKELMEEVGRTIHHMQDEAANFPDPSDRATRESEVSLELRARDRERKLIKKIEDTLNLIDKHEYGYCEVCGVEIDHRSTWCRTHAIKANWQRPGFRERWKETRYGEG